MISMKIRGNRAVVLDIIKKGKKTTKALKAFLKESLEDYKAKVKLNAEAIGRTGALADGVDYKITKGGLGGYVQGSERYSAFQNYGTIKNKATHFMTEPRLKAKRNFNAGCRSIARRVWH